ncbi:group III truncated hemoglobin [Flammeovirga kamogawensis]|uniref:Group III truncated hemoglobin n=1 Tax=Flammeovirga kamogawensis TaxID=373891 RepID=A0ABX8GVF5_9BACT|nr:group III truncated hemoglobin [Flammeovirga kamogawensis]MBB6460032.1 hemoglobin [Flammeovirga kamogawensis]QWG06920.1 group III truncated hemoglobin [Flammeovirga kamogawensis]TRX68741.1 group III truncated hemoglobin [Flammeovirga kamogawensis]
MEQIQNRNDVNKIVLSFYGRVRKDEVLGPIFNTAIHEEKWPEHLEKLTDFWYSNLFGVRTFSGNPVQAHIKTDNMMNNTMGPEHFERWLTLWFSTIESLFEGELAEKAKQVAYNIAQRQLMIVRSAR